MIDWLNNTNVILSIILACIAISGAIISIIVRIRPKPTPSSEEAYNIYLKEVGAGLGQNTALVVLASKEMLRGEIKVWELQASKLVNLGRPIYIGQQVIAGNLIYVAYIPGLDPGNYLIKFYYPQTGEASKAFSAVKSIKPKQITKIDWRKGKMSSRSQTNP